MRVPVEVIKQRAQAYHENSILVLRETLAKSGFRGLYRGYTSTILREIPFSLVQFPLWEYLKSRWAQYQCSPILPYQSMLCGSFAGGFSALVTTPLDVAKTNIMLQDYRDNSSASLNYYRTIASIYHTKGMSGYAWRLISSTYFLILTFSFKVYLLVRCLVFFGFQSVVQFFLEVMKKSPHCLDNNNSINVYIF